MKRIAALLALFIAAPVSGQDWERVFTADPVPDPGFRVLMLNPEADRASTDRYKLVSLADLMAPVYTFPDSATRYVAVKPGGGRRPTFTATDMLAGGISSALADAAPIPRPSGPSTWVAVAVPENRPLTYAAIGDANKRTDRTGAFVRQSGTVTIADTPYTVWVSNATFSGALDGRRLYFAR